MSKIIFEDMKNTKTIRSRKVEKISPSTKNVPKMHFINKDMAPTSYNLDNKRRNSNSKYVLWIVAILCLCGLIYAFSFILTKANITIIPRSNDVVLDQTLVASKDDKSAELYFSVVSIEDEEVKNVESSNEQDLSLPARGNIYIYNSFSKNTQVLNVDTRLEGSNGKIFKTDKKVTVPGIGDNGAPGKVEVGIYAIENGESYNSEPLDFKIIGFKNTIKYNKIYGRSNGPIRGGLVGKYSTISEIEKLGAISELKNTLKEKLYKKISDQVPEGYILYDNAKFFETFDEFVDDKATGGLVKVSVKAKLYGFLLNEKVLTTKIAKTIIEKYNNEEVYFNNISNLQFNLVNPDNINEEVSEITFKLTGNTRLIYKVDQNKIVNDLLSKDKKYFNQLLSEYLNIESASLDIFPTWVNTLPDKTDKFTIIVNYPK